MFLFDSEFFMERVSMPGGIARYIAEFIVQLYNNVIIGGAVVGLLLVLLQLLVWQLFKSKSNSSHAGYVMSFVPSLLLWYHMGAIMTRYTFVIALLMAVVAMCCCPRKNRVGRLVYLIVAVPLLSWLAGPVSLMLAFHAGLHDIFFYSQSESKQNHYRYLPLPVLVAYAVLSIMISGLLAPVSTWHLFYGVNYSFVLTEFPFLQYIVMGATAFIPFLISFIPHFHKKKTDIIAAGVLTGLIAVCCVVFFPGKYTARDYEVLRYDMLVRGQQWDKIIHISEQKNPDTPLTVASLNLALAIKGELSSRGVEFFQNGIQGAFPKFNKDFTTSIMTSEIYFYLGLVNIAERLAFEGMEGIPDNSLSVRVVKRLAEINIINGQYDVAKRYLLLLKKTLFYSKWANRMMGMLGNEKAISEHPLYGKLHSYLLNDDYLFSEAEIENSVIRLFMKCKDNSVAMQYLLFLPQLEGNKLKYFNYLDIVKRTLSGERVDSSKIMSGYNTNSNAEVDARTSASVQKH